MCAKIAQNHETKEERVKNPSKVLSSHIFCVPLHSTLSHSLQNNKYAYMPTQNRLKGLILKVFLEIQAYMKPTLSLHEAYTEPTQKWAKSGKSVTMAS